MKLYWGPHTCAIGIHILLEEIGKPYDTEKLDVAGGATEKPEFRAINPTGKVPTIVRDDGAVLTEFGAIAGWLARENPQAALLPEGSEARRLVDEVLDYAVGTIHAQGFGRILKPEKFEPQDVVHGKLGLGKGSVKEQGKKIVEDGFSLLDRSLAGRPYAAGDSFTIADAALFYVERWAAPQGIALPEHVDAHFRRLLARPSVQKVREMWGEA